jgi:septal ring factor EnvC (AmiA/AmiB activator)
LIDRPRPGPPRSPPLAPNSIDALERLLPIDQRTLEVERGSQHDKFYQVSKQLSLAISRRDAAKKQVKEMDARLSEEVRHGWRESEGRLTEKICADKVLLHPNMIDANEAVLQAEASVGLWFALRDAFHQRNDALEQLIKLYLSEHYGETRLERAAYATRAEAAERAYQDPSDPPPRRRY